VQPVNFKGEQGSAVLELIGFGLLIQIPLAVLASHLVLVQHDQLAAEAITRDVLRSFVLLDAEPSNVAQLAASVYGVAPSKILVSMACRPLDCRQEKAWVTVKTKVGSAIASGVIQR
jgi:hypothetical protein